MKGMMKAKQMETSAPVQPNYGSYHGNAERLATLRAKSVIGWMVALGLVIAGAWLAIDLGTFLAFLVGCLAALPVYVFSTHLWLNTDHVQAELWRAEVEAGKDLDGDGKIGEPRRETRYIEIKGTMVPFAEETTYPAEDATPVDLVPGFDAPVEVVLDFWRLATERGLGRSRLVTDPRLTIGNGLQLSRGIWDTFMTEAARRGWIVDGGNGSGYRWQYTPESIIQAIEMAAETARRAGRQTGQAGRQPGRAGDSPAGDWMPAQTTAGQG